MDKPSNNHQSLRNLIERLKKSETQTEESRQSQQFIALHNIVMHAFNTSPYYNKKFNEAGIAIKNHSPKSYFEQLPFLTRRDIQKAGNTFFSTYVPNEHMPLAKAQTSGSTGEPVSIVKTNINHLFWLAYTFREHNWWQRDINGSLAIIRAGVPETENSDWSSPLNILYKSGPSYTLPISTDISQQVSWLRKHKPDYLLTYPSNILEIIRNLQKEDSGLPFIKQIRLIGETLYPETRELAHNFFKVDVADTYSSQEVGYIAIQCPYCHQYHVMSESLIVEVLNEKDEPCSPGESGRVIVTDLYNTSTPLIRYELGDYAEVGRNCPKRPGLPTIKIILGRERNMLVLPDGKRFWPMLGYAKYREIADIQQYQIIQCERDVIEVRLVVNPELSYEQESKLKKIIHDALGYPFNLEFNYFKERLPLAKNGKFEEFVCKI